jgi:hypothetical protein
MRQSNLSALELEGRLWFRGALSEAELVALDRECAIGGPGARLGWNKEIAHALVSVDALARRLLPGARPVRLVAFDKNEDANWGLPWHQDRVIPLRDRFDVSGFSNWTRKSGIWHAEPPIALLGRVIFARVHLDPPTKENGCLELALGSHARGKILEESIASVATNSIGEVCEAGRGDVLFAKALVLHRSQPSRTQSSRRALRIDYSAARLPPPLEWAFDA